MPTGTSTLNFGAAPGTNQVDLAVTGQGSIVSGSYCEAWLSSTPHADHNIEEMKLLAGKVGILAHTKSEGVGFTITATTELRLTGNINIDWVWT